VCMFCEVNGCGWERNFCRTLLWIDFELKFVDFRRTEFSTIMGDNLIIVQIPMFWTASMRFHCEGPMKGAQEDPSYVRIGDTYSLSTLSFVLVGTGLFL